MKSIADIAQDLLARYPLVEALDRAGCPSLRAEIRYQAGVLPFLGVSGVQVGVQPLYLVIPAFSIQLEPQPILVGA